MDCSVEGLYLDRLIPQQKRFERIFNGLCDCILAFWHVGVYIGSGKSLEVPGGLNAVNFKTPATSACDFAWKTWPPSCQLQVSKGHGFSYGKHEWVWRLFLSVYIDRSLFLGKEAFSIAAHVFDLQFGTMYNPLHWLIYEESLDF